MNYSENQLIQLAQSNPKELSRLLTSPNASVSMLTFGAEILGNEVKDKELVIPVLKQLLKHINATVREGAAIGVSSFFMQEKPPSDILDRLKVMSNSDPSPALKEYAKSILQDFESLV